MTAAITVKGLRKGHGSLTAVDGINFEVGRNEIFGVVGPNNAGKTTTIERLESLRSADGGAIAVLGLDPVRDRRLLRGRIGVQLQQSALPDDLKVREALDLFASFYKKPADRRPLLQGLWFGEPWGRHVTATLVLGGLLAVGAAVSALSFRWE